MPFFFFDSHKKLHEVDGIRTEVLDYIGVVIDCIRVDSELFCEDLLDFVYDHFSVCLSCFSRSANTTHDTTQYNKSYFCFLQEGCEKIYHFLKKNYILICAIFLTTATVYVII